MKGINVICVSIRKALIPISTITLIIFAITFCFSFTTYNSSDDSLLQSLNIFSRNSCDLFKGSWVRFPEGPYYTNETNCEIDDRQNCIKFGRTDTEYMKWRWKPEKCELPLFDGSEFLEIVRGKTLAFLGDSVARNQMQSLKCLLASVASPVVVSDAAVERYVYKEHNFTLLMFWTPHLVRSSNPDPDNVSWERLMNLYTDEADRVWADEISGSNVVVISSGHWFFRPFHYYRGGRMIGCYGCNGTNITRHDIYYGYGLAFRTAFRALINLEKFKGTVILRTFSPDHFEHGEWNGGGRCARTRPYERREMKLREWRWEKMYLTQIQEYREAQREGSRRGLKFALLDASEAMFMRPDGHPNHYNRWPNKNETFADCVHWCLPGPVDTWNEFLLQLLKMEK